MTGYRHWQIGAVAFLLLIHFFIRSHNPLVQYAYVDEGFHNVRAAQIRDISQNPGRFGQGKVLVYVWIGLFVDSPETALPMSRFSIALFSLLTAAGIYQLGKTLKNPPTGLLAMGMYAIFPISLFYERMAMADPLVAGLMTLIAWRSLVFVKLPTYKQGFILGILSGFVTIAKLTAVLIPTLPVFAILFFSRNLHPRNLMRYLLPFALAGIVALMMWSTMLVPEFLSQGNITSFNLVKEHNLQSGDEAVTTARYFKDIQVVLDDFIPRHFAQFMAIEILLFTAIALFFREFLALRQLLFLIIWFLLLAGVPILTARIITSRYFQTIGVPIVLIIAFITLSLWDFSRSLSLIALTGILLWAATSALPFVQTDLTAPLELPFEHENNIEQHAGYFLSDEAVQQAAQTLNTAQPPGQAFYATWNLCAMMYFYSQQDLICLVSRGVVGDLHNHLKQDLQPGEVAYLAWTDYGEFYFQNIPGLGFEQLEQFERERIRRPVTVWQLWWETGD